MLKKIKQVVFKGFFPYDKENNLSHNSLKIILLGFSFFFIIGSYSVLRPLKASVFLALIGKEYVPIAKMISIIILFPCMLFYAKLVDRLKQSQVVRFFLILYSIGGVVFALFLLHPTIGLNNSQTSVYRLIGWLFYFYLDLFSAFVVSTFWAFANSINNPEYAKQNYGKIVAFSRIGGISTPLISWLLIQKTSLPGSISIPILIIATSLFLLLASFCISRIIKKIPHQLLHGYEAAYKVDKRQSKSKVKVGLLQGLMLMITKPYVLAIFGITYSYEVISVILDYQMQILMSIANNNAILGMSSFMFIYTASFQGLGLVFALFGTSNFLRWIGVKKCLLIMPLMTILLMLSLLAYPSLSMIFIIMVLLRALNYGFNAPIKEILYIPTTKNIKFKSKAWIESFGRSLSKTSGSTLNLIAQAKNTLNIIRLDSIYAIGISIVWTIISCFIGKKYNEIIENNQVIGEDDL